MSESIVAEGKTTNEAIENGLKLLKTKKENVEIKVLEQEDKRSFFSILAPRVIKVELTLKEEKCKKEQKEQKEQKEVKKVKSVEINEETLKIGEKNVTEFLDEFLKKLNIENLERKISIQGSVINVSINGDKINYLIGYRGEVLNSIQLLLNNIANKNTKERCKVILDIENYRTKREKTLQDLADKVSKTVIKNRKNITLEPMTAYERKIIHSRLQNNPKVITRSIGEEPNRKIVIELK